MRAVHQRTLRGVGIRNRAAGLFCVGILALSVTACGGADSAPEGVKAAPSSPFGDAPATPSKADPARTEKAALRQAYTRFWAEQVKAYAKADISSSRLTKYASGEALARARGDVAAMKQAGTVTQGAPRHQVRLSPLSQRGKVQAATVTDCLDISRWKTVKARSGAQVPFPKQQPLRYVTSVSAEKWGEQWMIIKVTPQGDRTC
ncbi:hypothetical protein [Streptomyces sp. NEAU-S7GS2]|uniref:hypothetical protein n=1 Tax=Streptomyces sp. NEAU-S7GS2 TaxID=2202000 RepID=UPI000D6EB614|nr:hypothetical protein [Streptomyces sp. NEAU-S7GS2]AWN24797.1 hypothetical protein DKG71_00135 [Streptomyces sp. NEAU-S7GS2]